MFYYYRFPGFVLCVRACVCVTDCIHGLILKSPVGSFQALSHSFPPSLSDLGLSIVCCTQTLLGAPAPGDFNTHLETKEGGRDGPMGRKRKYLPSPAARGSGECLEAFGRFVFASLQLN